MLTVGVHDEEFMSWIKGVENQFVAMTETMIRIAENIKHRVQTETVPLETGRLSRSFRWKILTDNSRMKVLQVQMSALNPNTGYDYAWIQHDNYLYKHDSTELGFYHYHKYSGDDEYTTSHSDIDTWTHHHGRSHYLMWGIIYEQYDAYQMIEHDYLSLFYGAFIDGGHIL